jgi:hypothetical protein
MKSCDTRLFRLECRISDWAEAMTKISQEQSKKIEALKQENLELRLELKNLIEHIK